jgi:uncharacterized protein
VPILAGSLFFLAIPGEIVYFSFLLFFRRVDPRRRGRRAMRLFFDEITGRSRHYSIPGNQWFPAVDGASVLAAAASLEASRKDPQTVLLKGEVIGSYRVVCDRCSEPYIEELCCDFVYLATTAPEEHFGDGERELEESEEITLYLKEPVIEVDQLLTEQVLLAIPQKRLCSEHCRGICVGCGAVLNQDLCRCGERETTSPFSVLKRLQKQ